MRKRPQILKINAWTDEGSPEGRLVVSTWRMEKQPRLRDARDGGVLAPPPLVDLRDWRDLSVGWGLLLPDRPGLDHAARASAQDAPEPIRELLNQRRPAPVLRWSPTVRAGRLLRCYNDGAEELPMAAADYGLDRGKLPRYLLIYASPEEIPWKIQYQLNLTNFVGRLTLTGDALANYVQQLMTDWADAPAPPVHPVVWSPDWGPGDITGLMASAIGKPLAEAYARDPALEGRPFITGSKATRTTLGQALTTHQPGLICTTSHGYTGWRDGPERLRARLGALVDARREILTEADLDGWAPSGAIWYAHACCSAGSDAASRYEQLFPETDELGASLRGIAAAAGARVSPLPERLLGHARPLRAFIGHVEPTFDWTLRDPFDDRVLTHGIVSSLYNRLFQADRRATIAWALENVFLESARLYGVFRDYQAKIDTGIGAPPDIDPLYQELAAMDRQTLVILGDPTAALPAASPR